MRITERGREREAETPNVGLNPGTPGLHPKPKADPQLLSHPGVSRPHSLKAQSYKTDSNCKWWVPRLSTTSAYWLQIGGFHDPLLEFSHLLEQLIELREGLTYVYQFKLYNKYIYQFLLYNKRYDKGYR